MVPCLFEALLSQDILDGRFPSHLVSLLAFDAEYSVSVPEPFCRCGGNRLRVQSDQETQAQFVLNN